MSSRIVSFVAAAVACAVAGNCAYGDFVNGVETFDGNELDLTTWRLFEYNRTGFVSQSGSLRIDARDEKFPAAIGHYASQEALVPVGGAVHADVTVHSLAPIGYGFVRMELTSGQGGGSAGDVGTTHIVSSVFSQEDRNHRGVLTWSEKREGGTLRVTPSRALESTRTDNPNLLAVTPEQYVGQTYAYRIERVDDDVVRFSLWRRLTDGTAVRLGHSLQELELADGSPMRVGLAAHLVDVTFDNVAVNLPLVPEPGTGVVVAAAGWGLVLRRRG